MGKNSRGTIRILMCLLLVLCLGLLPGGEVFSASAAQAGKRTGFDASGIYYRKGVRQKKILVKESGAYYYIGADGKAVQDTWISLGKSQYYFGADGKAATGALCLMNQSTFTAELYWFSQNGKLNQKRTREMRKAMDKYEVKLSELPLEKYLGKPKKVEVLDGCWGDGKDRNYYYDGGIVVYTGTRKGIAYYLGYGAA